MLGGFLDNLKGYLPKNNEQITDEGGDYTLPIVLAVVFIILAFLTVLAVRKK